MQRIRRRAHERRRAQRLHGVEPRERVGAAAGNGQRAQRAGALEARPEADEEPEREREIDAVAGPEPRAREDEAPAVRPPLPRGLRVQPPQRRSRRPGRLMHAHVALERIGQVRAERWMRPLVLDQFGFGGKREAGTEILHARHIERDPRGLELPRIKSIGRK